MKRYNDFINEARGSDASRTAIALGLVSDAHGGWEDRAGRLVGKTVNGRFEFIRKKPPKLQKAEPERNTYKQPERQEEPLQKRVPQERKISPPQQQEPAPEPKTKKSLTIVFGRFNPPTIGHEKLIKKASEVANNGDFKIYPSRMYGDPLNPLDPPTKIYYMRKAFPKFADNIINDDDMKTIFDVLIAAHEDGYDSVNLVTGSKRKAEFDRLASQYNGELYDFAEINVVPFPGEDPDLENSPNPTSSSKLRKAAAEDDFFEFQKGLPKKLDQEKQRDLFFATQRALEGEVEVQNESWKIAPKLYYQDLKENYHLGSIFNPGDMIENLNTGLDGKIIRRGPNYVICVNETYNIMFKSWIEDIREWTDVSGVPANQREIGTDALRDYVMKLTQTKAIDNFLKKRKKINNNKDSKIENYV